MELKYRLPLLAVSDVERAKAFYHDLFDQNVEMDLGWNVSFDGGFAVQQNFAWLTDVAPESVAARPNNMELYFEVDDFDAFIDRLAAYPDVAYVHPPKEHEWRQRVVRIYDPDGHMIEIGESMVVIAKRYLAAGKTVEQTAEIIQHPVEFVRFAAEQ